MANEKRLIELVDQARRYAANKCHSFMSCAECDKYGEYDGNCRNAYIAESLIANGVTIQKWIPASEPPKEDGKYLVRKLIFDRTSIIEVLSYAHDGEKVDEYDLKGEKNVWYKYDSEVGYYASGGVTHWMPLPEMPKE